MPNVGTESFRVRFRRETDVGEQHNVAGEHPESVERLAKMLAGFHAETEKNLRPAGSAGAK